MTTRERENDLPKLAAPARRALAGAGIDSLRKLAAQRASVIASLHGMGPNAMATLTAALSTKGLRFKGE